MSSIDLAALKERISTTPPSNQTDFYTIEAIKEAVGAAEAANFGVGAILVDDKTGNIVCRGRNTVFTENRSDLHAEMDLLNTFETLHGSKSRELLRHMTLYTSLESCPMCLCRIITAGVSRVFHVADDEDGGMVHLYRQLPETWQEISENRVFKKAECSEALSDIAMQVFLSTSDLNNRLSGF